MLVVGIRGAFVSLPAPFPELMDKKAFVIMERGQRKWKTNAKRDSAAPIRRGDLRDFTYYCDSFRFFALFTVYFFGKGSLISNAIKLSAQNYTVYH